MTMMEADARPEKRLFLEMFIRDLTLEDCVLDLVDNSIDSLIRSRGIDVSEALLPLSGENGESVIEEKGFESARIEMKFDPKSFHVADTCGGISVQDARDEVFRFGHTAGVSLGQLGAYGIGLKRAIFKIGNHITIESRTDKDGFRMDIDVRRWAEDRFNWKLPFEVIEGASDLGSAGTSITIEGFSKEVEERFKSEVFEKHLYDMIARTYCLFLRRYVTVSLNECEVEPAPIPLGLSENANIAKEEFDCNEVKVTLYAGLAARDADGQWRQADAGWYAACNGRFVVAADKTDLMGWGYPGPLFVPKYRGFVGIAFFYSKDPLLLPWTTMKRGLNRESLVFQRARTRMAVIAKPVLRFLDQMYSTQEVEREPQREVATRIQSVDVRILTARPTAIFRAEAPPPGEASVRVQYDAKERELDRVRKHLRKSGWPATRIGRFTFDHYLKTECPE